MAKLFCGFQTVFLYPRNNFVSLKVHTKKEKSFSSSFKVIDSKKCGLTLCKISFCVVLWPNEETDFFPQRQLTSGILTSSKQLFKLFGSRAIFIFGYLQFHAKNTFWAKDSFSSMLIVKLEDEAEELNHFQKFQNVWKNWPVSKPKGWLFYPGGISRGPNPREPSPWRRRFSQGGGLASQGLQPGVGIKSLLSCFFNLDIDKKVNIWKTWKDSKYSKKWFLKDIV